MFCGRDPRTLSTGGINSRSQRSEGEERENSPVHNERPALYIWVEKEERGSCLGICLDLSQPAVRSESEDAAIANDHIALLVYKSSREVVSRV